MLGLLLQTPGIASPARGRPPRPRPPVGDGVYSLAEIPRHSGYNVVVILAFHFERVIWFPANRVPYQRD